MSKCLNSLRTPRQLAQKIGSFRKHPPLSHTRTPEPEVGVLHPPPLQAAMRMMMMMMLMMMVMMTMAMTMTMMMMI